MAKEYDGFFRVVSLLFTTFAGLFILIKDWQFSKPEFMLIGLVMAFGGCLLAAVPGKSWSVVFGLIVGGFYCMGRAIGQIDRQYFRYGVGTMLLVLSAVHLYQLIYDPIYLLLSSILRRLFLLKSFP